MMIPITRKEKYINEIVGGGRTAPGTPQTREELFFADILGEVVAPSPITRAEKYLAKIANKYSGELPEPVTRIERFLARAAGMDVTIPTPITREEIFWADYALIVEKELSGIPPLTFNAIAGALKNYRIYGNTVNGESVGDRTENLFYKKIENANIASNDGRIYSTESFDLWIGKVKAGETYTSYNVNSIVGFFTDEPDYGACTYDNSRITTATSVFTFTVPNGCSYVGVRILKNDPTAMLNVGSTDLPYEPYGYRIPITNNSETANIYLDEPLAKSGNNADYIDYETQKRHNSDGTENNVILPEITVTAGTNTLTVGTEVQPSNVYIKYEGER